MRALETRKRGEIIADIIKEVRRRAAAEGYDFVFDNSGLTTNDQPAVLVAPKNADITDTVIKELNRTASRPAVPEPKTK
jgi:Skp family chaperone for outer membrane proteins